MILRRDSFPSRLHLRRDTLKLTISLHRLSLWTHRHHCRLSQIVKRRYQDHAIKMPISTQRLITRSMIFHHQYPMTTNSPPRCILQDTINLGNFLTLDEATILHQIHAAFQPELERLKNATAVEGTAEQRRANGTPDHPSPSQILYGTNYDEINRTLVGVLALRWILNNDYHRFTQGQPLDTKLTQSSFQWLHDLFFQGLTCSEDMFALILSMVINDLGKDPNLVTDFESLTHRSIPDQNHDAILLEAANVDMIPALRYLTEEKKQEVLKGLELGSELNAGQLAQAESVPFNLEGLYEMRGHLHAFELKFMEQILDVAAAAGHLDCRGAKNFIEPVHQAFKMVREVSLDIIDGKSNLRQGYDKVLTKRGNLLVRAGFRKLSVGADEDRALLRLLTMGRTTDKHQAELFSEAFQALEDPVKAQLVRGLNIDGNVNETAVLPYYMPAIMSKTLERTRDLSQEDRQRALTSLMKYLARVLATDPGDTRYTPDGQVPGIIIERNMSIVQEVIDSPAFKANPNFDALDVPDGHVLLRRRTSQSM
ncbi:hypothetical protein PV10_01541 [Exophiala mesophila]|uniref:Uncharacterized protein n=1 Tax=Exophiala mesophila TaxID=212818 RepID=A0A0D1YB24_EXOME|nr:uncharacterized protein PV10_01541 [Exophiala mesophila]KIV97836.1 hypothetical protein PV10_01541 [Exophiala mesophila]